MKIKFLITEKEKTDINKFLKKTGIIPLFIHFSNSEQWASIAKAWKGYGFDTPFGVYTYPYASGKADFSESEFPYGYDRKYIHFFTINPNHKGQILSIGNPDADYETQFGFPQYTERDWEIDKKRIILWYKQKNSVENIKDLLDDIEYSIRTAKNSDSITHMWNVTRNVTSNSKQWTELLRWLGYDGFVDHGTGLIHPNEPMQSLFLGSHILNHIGTFRNPNDSSVMLKKTVSLGEGWKLKFYIRNEGTSTYNHFGEEVFLTFAELINEKDLIITYLRILSTKKQSSFLDEDNEFIFGPIHKDYLSIDNNPKNKQLLKMVKISFDYLGKELSLVLNNDVVGYFNSIFLNFKLHVEHQSESVGKEKQNVHNR